MNTLINNNKLNKKKVIFVMGATGTGKSRLSIDLAIHFQGEIINSDKMQIYKGLDILTNKLTDAEKRGVPHHLLSEIEQDAEFTAADFCFQANFYIENILKSECVPIIAGGSNSYIEKLVEDPSFQSKYNCCFIWIDVVLPILYSSVSERVDHMVCAGLVDEVRKIFILDADYTKGIRRSIGVPELDAYLRKENKANINEELKEMPLESVMEEIKQMPHKDALEEFKQIPLESIVAKTKQISLESALIEPIKQIPLEFSIEEMKQMPFEHVIEEIKQVPIEAAMEKNKQMPLEYDIDETKQTLLESAIEEIKLNTCKLVYRQLEKIRRLRDEKMWPLHHIDATNVLRKVGKKDADDSWKEIVLNPCLKIVDEFLKK